MARAPAARGLKYDNLITPPAAGKDRRSIPLRARRADDRGAVLDGEAARFAIADVEADPDGFRAGGKEHQGALVDEPVFALTRPRERHAAPRVARHLQPFSGAGAVAVLAGDRRELGVGDGK